MKNIKTLRMELGLSQKELAKSLNVHQTAVSQWEQGRTAPDIEIAKRIADFFKVSLDFVLDYTDEKEINEKPLVNEDEELTEYLEELKNREELRMLFSLTKGATKADVEKAVKIIEAYLKD